MAVRSENQRTREDGARGRVGRDAGEARRVKPHAPRNPPPRNRSTGDWKRVIGLGMIGTHLDPVDGVFHGAGDVRRAGGFFLEDGGGALNLMGGKGVQCAG